MKKLLLLSLSLMLVGGNVFTAVPQQSLFSQNLVHTFEEIDTDKLTAVKSVISKGDALSRALIYLDTVGELTESKVLSLINSRYNITGNDITSLDNLPIIELLKEHKNVLVQEIAKYVIIGSSDDLEAGDYVLFSFGFIAHYALLKEYRLQNPESSTLNLILSGENVLGTVSSLFPVILYRIYKLRNKIRSREDKMNQIDKIITQIEAFQTAKQ